MPSHARRQFLRGGLTAGITSIAGCVGFGGGVECSTGSRRHEFDVELSGSAFWPSFQFDPANTGHAPDRSGPTDDVGVAWRYTGCTPAESGVVVSDPHVYAGGRVIDGRTGESIGGEWEGPVRTPAITGDTVFTVTTDLVIKDAMTGETRRTLEADPGRGALPSPNVAEETVYVAGLYGGNTVSAIDATDLNERWRFEANGGIDSPVALVGETLYAVAGNRLHAIDTKTGDEVWTTAWFADFSRCPPVVGDGRVYLGSWDGTVLAIGTDGEETIWRRDVGFRTRGPVSFADGTVYASGRDGTMVALNAATGETQWRFTTDAYELTSPVIADGTVYVGERRGSNAVIAVVDGEDQWRVETRVVDFGDTSQGGVRTGIAVVNGVVYAATGAGDVYAIAER